MAAPNHPENAVLTASDSITADLLSELSTALNELQPLASKISDLKKETLEREAAVLKAILEKMTPLVLLLSKESEQHCRREIVILTREERVQPEEGFGFFSEYKLVLYENSLLGCTHPILKGLIKVIGDASSMDILKEKLEGDLSALTKALEALR